MSTRQRVRASQREFMNRHEKSVAKVMGIPKGLRQYFKRLGVLPSMIQQEYKKHQ